LPCRLQLCLLLLLLFIHYLSACIHKKVEKQLVQLRLLDVPGREYNVETENLYALLLESSQDCPISGIVLAL